nr:GDSL-type esterase/lipase family protein [Candidatus Sigynarchaeota archaeon]
MKKNVTLIIILLFFAGNVVVNLDFLALENYRHSITPDLIISTIGDSLTDSGHYNTTVEYGVEYMVEYTNCYQYYTYQYLKVRNLETRVRNLGIGGQTISQICARFNDTVPANYTVCMAGTNDMWGATPGIYDILAAHVIDTYNATMFNTMAYQQSLGHAPPVIILCSIPPLGYIAPGILYVPGAILHVNAALEAYVKGLNRTDVVFCDVHAAMSNDAGWMIDGLYVADGVHFTIAGDQVCGEAVAQAIAQHYYHHGR